MRCHICHEDGLAGDRFLVPRFVVAGRCFQLMHERCAPRTACADCAAMLRPPEWNYWWEPYLLDAFFAVMLVSTVVNIFAK